MNKIIKIRKLQYLVDKPAQGQIVDHWRINDAGKFFREFGVNILFDVDGGEQELFVHFKELDIKETKSLKRYYDKMIRERRFKLKGL